MRFKLILIGGPNCGSAILTEVAVWPPPYILHVHGNGHGWYAQTWLEGPGDYEAWPDDGCVSARYEWHTA